MRNSEKSIEAASQHPAARFQATGSMAAGGSLATIIGPKAISLLAESISVVNSQFDAKSFQATARKGLDKLGIMQRGAHVARALHAALPMEFPKAVKVLVSALGPELTVTEGNGLAVFFYLPHSFYIGEHGLEHFEHGMLACYELTKRFTAEFCIRHYIARDQDGALKFLRKWARDKNPHVRRLVSEGTRSRLPWGMRLKIIQADPSPVLPLLEQLKDDESQYVRRSVANHLGDIIKDSPEIGFAICERWTEEVSGKRIDPEIASARKWIVRHAVRLPAKKGHARALSIRAAAKV